MADGTQALPGNRFPHKGRGKPREAAREGEGAGGQQLVPLRKSGGNCGEQDRTSPISHIKEVCENKDEKWTFEDSGITTVLEKANSPGSGLLQVNEDNNLNEVYQDETRSAKKTTQGIQQRQCQINSTDDEITQSWEIASEDYEWLHSKNTLLLIEKLRMDCKDSVSLLKIQDAVLSYERLIEFKKSHCRLLIGKIRYMENKVSRLQKQLSEIREEKTQLECQTVEREQECCSLRFTLKKEKEKRRNADTLSEKIGEELKRKEKQYSKEVEMKEQLELTIKTVEMELRTVRSNLNQLQEAQNRNIVQEAMKRLESENSQLKLTIKEQADRIKQIHQNLLNPSSIDDLRIKLDTASSKCQHMYTVNEALQQQLRSLKTIERKYKKLEEEKNQLKQTVINLKNHIEMNMAEYDQVALYKQEIEERARQYIVDRLKEVNLFLQAQSASQENINQSRDNSNSYIRTHMELKINDLESEISKLKAAKDSNNTELEKYKLFYLQELKDKKSLSTELNETKRRLAEVTMELHTEKKLNRSLLSTLTMRPVLKSPCCGNPKNSFMLNRDLVVKENLVIPILRPQPSNNTMDDYLTKVLTNVHLYSTSLLRYNLLKLKIYF
ncbi:ankyrin repeat domain-containing protein 26-like isoform X2 [Lepus europaeus]|uniref:ankyrin repeat domain-containing protein 26-like isoform X2 n=1 Tax=Lepus europaeus TaxID=9983 RepID=UPI002B46B01C|nr:ankyrin repeat domain-containing protein 26-like isoform X2 [Lepus europaeus]